MEKEAAVDLSAVAKVPIKQSTSRETIFSTVTMEPPSPLFSESPIIKASQEAPDRLEAVLYLVQMAYYSFMVLQDDETASNLVDSLIYTLRDSLIKDFRRKKIAPEQLMKTPQGRFTCPPQAFHHAVCQYLTAIFRASNRQMPGVDKTDRSQDEHYVRDMMEVIQSLWWNPDTPKEIKETPGYQGLVLLLKIRDHYIDFYSDLAKYLEKSATAGADDLEALSWMLDDRLIAIQRDLDVYFAKTFTAEAMQACPLIKMLRPIYVQFDWILQYFLTEKDKFEESRPRAKAKLQRSNSADREARLHQTEEDRRLISSLRSGAGQLQAQGAFLKAEPSAEMVMQYMEALQYSNALIAVSRLAQSSVAKSSVFMPKVLRRLQTSIDVMSLPTDSPRPWGTDSEDEQPGAVKKC